MAMAKLMCINIFLSIVLLLMIAPALHGAPLMSEIPDPGAVSAYKEYWKGFEAYEGRILENGNHKFKEAWTRLKESYDQKKRLITESEIRTLKLAIDKYRHHMENHAGSANMPYVMLNLAQIMNRLGDHYLDESKDTGLRYKEDAISILHELAVRFKEFGHRDETLYLKALIAESLGRDKLALTTWNALAGSPNKTIYSVYGNIAVGDHHFNGEDPPKAMASYRLALRALRQEATPDYDYELLRIQYRLTWAAYRSGELSLAIQTGVELLKPGRSADLITHKNRIQADAIEIIGDALYENNDIDDTKKVLEKKELLQFSPSILLRTIQNYLAARILSDVIALAEFGAASFPTATELPDFLVILADGYKEIKDVRARVRSLEKLSLLLPAQSLWRGRNRDKYEAIKGMENKAHAAGKTIAEHYYQHGMETGSASSFLSASAYYEMLIDHDPNGKESNRWRLRRANCAYFSEHLEEAESGYVALVTQFKVSVDILKVAAHQLALVREKIWRIAYDKSAKSGKNPGKDPLVVEVLRKMEKSIEEYADRFPTRPEDEKTGSYTVDLLLAAAAANRDQEDYPSATGFWHRVLVSNPSSAQRTIAIRGLMMAEVAKKNTAGIIELARKYLHLDNWDTNGLGFANELKGMLATALAEESERLNKEGKVLEAGALLVNVCREFPDIPNRDRLERDGAYLLAIGGDWKASQATSERYLASGRGERAADMLYLKARSLEYQLRFIDAANAYLELGRSYPKHTRAATSLERAMKLALAEEDYITAGRCAMLQGERSPNGNRASEHFSAAYAYFQKAGDPALALTAAEKRGKVSNNRSDRLISQLMRASSDYKAGNEWEALEQYRKIATEADRHKSRMNKSEYAEIAGEANFFLGEEANAIFKDYVIKEREGAVNVRVGHKIKYFEALTIKYDKAVTANHPEWSTRANYMIGEAAESLADEIAALRHSEEIKVSQGVQDEWLKRISQLRKLAEISYSNNMMLRNRDPKYFADNVWIKKSGVKLVGYSDAMHNSKKEEIMPTATSDNMTTLWSL